MGHLEACAAAAGLASLMFGALAMSLVVANARLIRSVDAFQQNVGEKHLLDTG